LDFLCSIDPKDILGDTSGETDEEYRQRALRDEFIGKEISTREIAGQLNTKYPEIDVSQKTIQRDLEKIGAKYNKKTRKWKI
jgi:arginine repressor